MSSGERLASISLPPDQFLHVAGGDVVRCCYKLLPPWRLRSAFGILCVKGRWLSERWRANLGLVLNDRLAGGDKVVPMGWAAASFCGAAGV